MRELVGYPARYLLDGYYYTDLSTAIRSPALFIACIALVLAVVVMMRSQPEPTQNRVRPYLVAILLGMVTIFLPLTPFLVTGYYMPSRVLFIPSIGFAVVCGAVFGMVWTFGKAKWMRMGLAGLVVAASMVYVLANRTAQVQFAELWQKEDAVIQHVLQEYPAPESGTSFALLHFPRLTGAVPTFVNDFSFPGIIRWLYRNESITGKTSMSLSDFLGWDEYLDASQPRSWVASPDQKGIIYSNAREKAMSISHLLTMNETTLITGGYRQNLSGENENGQEPVSIAVVTPLTVSVDYTHGLGLELRDAMWLRDSDLFCVRITVQSPSESRRLRLLVHASYRNGSVVPYDRDLLERNAFQFSEGKFYADVLIDDASNLGRLDFQLTDSGRVLPIKIEDSSGQPSMAVLTRALSPGITVGIADSLVE